MKSPYSHVPRQPLAVLPLIPLIMALGGLAWPLRAPAQNQLTLIDVTSTVWRFNDSGADLGTAWKEISYSGETNADWSTGTSLFGVETTEPYPPFYPAPIATPLVLGAGRITYYFRTRFLLPQDPASNIVEVALWADDGAVVYVNGAEVARIRLPDDPVLFNTRAQLANPEGLPLVFTNDPSKLVLGTNVIAVEVHQNHETSADVVFGLRMVATGTLAPEILDPNEPADRTVNQGQPTTFTVIGSGIPTPDYRWYHYDTNGNGGLVPGANGPTLTIASVGAADAGDYFAVLSNSLGTAMSRTAVLTYLADTNPPYILYALARPQDPLTSFLLPFSEPLEPSSAMDTFNWGIFAADGSDRPGGLIVCGSVLEYQTNLTLFTCNPREPAREYIVVAADKSISDLNGVFLAPGTTIPVAAYPLDLMYSSNSWRYENSGTDLGVNWLTPTFNDSAWSNGPAPLDVFRASAETAEPHCRFNGLLPIIEEPVGTCLLTLSNAADTAQYSTAYFRTRFYFSGDAAHSVLSFYPILVDDGAVFYLNGTELFRLGMPDGPVSYDTLANRTVGNALPEFLELAPRGLVEGENVLAVEVHQDSLISADLTLGVSVRAFVPSPIVAPQLTAALASGNITISWTPAVGRLQSATDVAGPWNDVAPSPPPNPYTEPAGGERKFYRVAFP